MPDDSPVLANIPTTLPCLQSISSSCKTILPSSLSHHIAQNDLTILHINSRSLHQNFDAITSLVSKENVSIDCLLLSETWVKPDVAQCYTIDGYEMLHSIPTANVTGKGCAIYIKNALFPYCTVLNDLSVCQTEFQSICVLVTLPAVAPFIVCTLYRSPSYPLSLLMQYLEESLDKISDINKPCFWGGDFNVNLFKCNENRDSKLFLDCMNSYGFFPTITVPTRISNIPPFTATLIDNIFTNVPDTIQFSGALCAGIADHQAVCCSTDLVQQRPATKRAASHPKFNYNRIEELKVNVSQNLDGFLDMHDPDQCVQRLVTVIQSKVSELSVTGSARNTTPIQPWVTPGLLRSINIRNTLLKRFLSDRTSENLNKFKKYRNVLRLATRNAKKAYYHAQFTKNAGNPKRLWGDLLEAIQKRKVRSELPPSYDVNGSSVCAPEPIANLFNEYFSQVASTLDAALGPSNVDPLSYLNDVVVPEVLTFRPVSSEFVSRTIHGFNDVGAGIDGINTKLLKHLVPVILPQLTHLVNLCLSQSKFPAMLKTALITPIYKSGSRSLFSNYRPISVLPVLSKVLESVMYDQLLSFINEHNIIYECQFGFRTKHSTFMPLCILHDYITSNLVDGRTTVGIYLDLARAFDTVNIDILLKKLPKYGITGNALKLFVSYLSDRTHCLKYKDSISGTKSITCGVPQGSVLGPILFLLYINDLPKTCEAAKFLLFADDTAILYSAQTTRELQTLISTSFPKITKWLHANRLSLSIPKTFYQLYSPNCANSTDLAIPVKDTNIKRSSTVKYLGVLMDEDLKFKSHISKVSGLISRNIGIMSRAKYLLNKKLLILLYNALILPYLNYCSVIWGSNYISNLKPVITAQKRVIRLLAGAGRIAHTSPLFRELRLLKLTDLVNKQLLLILHDYLIGRLPDIMCRKFALHDPARPSRTVRHFSETVTTGDGSMVPNYRLHNYRLFSPFCRAPKTWNQIIASRVPVLRDVPASKNLFKKCILLLFLDEY